MTNDRSAPGAALAAVLALAAATLPTSAGAAGQEGMVAVRDRVTGQLRAPTADELRTLRSQQRQLQAPQALAPSVRRPDGTRHLHLGERGMVYSVLTRDAGGKETMQCVHGEHAAGAAVSTPATNGQGEHNHDHR